MEKSTRNLLIIVGVVALGVTAYYFYDRRKKTVSLGVTADSKQNKITFTRN